VHGTTIIENKDASFNCDSLDNETLNDNCGDIVQLHVQAANTAAVTATASDTESRATITATTI